MSHPYGTLEAFRNVLGSTATSALAGLDGSTVTAVWAQHMDDAANDIDARLGRVYVVPFNAITASTPTPGIVSTMCYRLAAASLLIMRGQMDLAAVLREIVKQKLDELADGDGEIPSATKRDAEDGKGGLDYDAGRPVFAGRDNDGVDNDDDTDRMSGW